MYSRSAGSPGRAEPERPVQRRQEYLARPRIRAWLIYQDREPVGTACYRAGIAEFKTHPGSEA